MCFAHAREARAIDQSQHSAGMPVRLIRISVPLQKDLQQTSFWTWYARIYDVY